MPVAEIYESLRDDFELIALYTDSTDDPKPAEVFARYFPKGGSVPIYVIMDPDGEVIDVLTWPTTRAMMTKEEFSEFMRTGLAKFKASAAR